MPANKYALLRYRIIDRCLTNRMRPFPTKEDLRRACEEGLYGSEGERISISTIEKDLWAMRNENELGYHAPIVYNAEHRGYEYEDPDYSISGLNLQEQDLQALRFATLTLLQFRDMPVFQQYQSAIGRIFDRVHATAPRQGIDQHIQFEQAPQTLGTEHIAAVLAIEHGRLRQPADRAETTGHQRQPPVVHQGSSWQWQGLLQQGAVAEDRAAGDLIAQGQLPERWGVAADAVPLPEAFSQGIPFGVDQLSIAMVEQRLRAASGVGLFSGLQQLQACAQALRMP